MSSLARPKSTQDLLAVLGAHGPAIASVLLGIALGIQGGLIVTGSGLHAPAGVSAASAHAHAAARPLDLSIIINRHLFQSAAAKGNGADAPETSASLVLAGVLAVGDPERGMAILGPNATTAKLYAAGADVPGGVRLHAVYKDRVILDRGGTLEALYLPRLAGGVAPAPPLATTPAAPGQRLANFARNNGGLLNGLVRVQPVYNGAKLSGYRLFPGTGGVPGMTRLGLKSGDLVTAVNGTALDDPNRANDILQTLSNASSATVTITRNGVEQDVNLNLESVATEAEAAAEAAAQNPNDNTMNGPGGRMGFGRPMGARGPMPSSNGSLNAAAGQPSASGDSNSASEPNAGAATAGSAPE